MKKQIAIIISAFLIVGLSTGFAQAGAARRHTIEGFLLGTGVTLLGTAIVNSMNRPQPVVVHTPPRHEYRYAKTKHRKGHWETRKIWVAPEYETRWNPGHYNKRGRWVQGRYEEFQISDGYWQKERVWVRHNRRY
jgi:hypothetical protein